MAKSLRLEELARREQEALDFWLNRSGLTRDQVTQAVRQFNAGQLIKGPPHDLVGLIFDDPVMNGTAKILAVRALQGMAWTTPAPRAQLDLLNSWPTGSA